MKNENIVIVRNLKETPRERGSCGARSRLITERDCDAVAFSHLKISDAQKHYHKETTEFYYVLKGKGELEVDEEVIPLEEGILVMIKPGAVHRAISYGELEVLIAMTPPVGEIGDQYYLQDSRE